MQLVFLGTRANTEERNRRHRRHSALLVLFGGARIMIDCGLDWLTRLDEIAPTGIVVTHAHPDHAWGLKRGAPCAVYATEACWNGMASWPLQDQRKVCLREPVKIGGLTLEAFSVEHSVRAPAVGFRIAGGAASFFYVPDVVAIRERGAALRGIDLYIGDGAALSRSLVRRRGAALFGHTPISTQLGWCRKEGVPRALFTHCGGEVIRGDERTLGAFVRRLGRERGVEARIAYDGLRVKLSCAEALAPVKP